jgi:antitoxin VapB
MVDNYSTMSLNIKNTEAHALATELAELRGVSVTKAVTDALKHELDRERGRSRRTGMARDLAEIGRRCAAHIKGPLCSADHATMLYDERGLPR